MKKLDASEDNRVEVCPQGESLWVVLHSHLKKRII